MTVLPKAAPKATIITIRPTHRDVALNTLFSSVNK